jgi:hypothetical protein
MSMGDRSRGLYDKFCVIRTDGTSGPGKKHDGCRYFVLDMDHDPHARAAVKAYADSCRAEYPLLAADLDARAENLPFGSRVPTNGTRRPPAPGGDHD